MQVNDNLYKVLSKTFPPERCYRFCCKRQRVTQLSDLRTVEGVVLSLFSHCHFDLALQNSLAFRSMCTLGDDEPACLGTEASPAKERSQCEKENNYLLNAEALRSDFHQSGMPGLDFGKVCHIWGKL